MSREVQEKPKMVPWLPRSSQETPKSIPEEPKSLRRGSQEHPKGAQESPKTPSEPWSDQKRRFFRIRRMSQLKSTILRLAWSSWELKIDPKKVKEENKHVLEEDMSRRRCQESSKKLPKSSKVTIHGACQQIMSSEGAAETSQGAPRELLRSLLVAKMEFGEAQKRSPEALKTLEYDLKIKNLDVHKTS